MVAESRKRTRQRALRMGGQGVSAPRLRTAEVQEEGLPTMPLRARTSEGRAIQKQDLATLESGREEPFSATARTPYGASAWRAACAVVVMVLALAEVLGWRGICGCPVRAPPLTTGGWAPRRQRRVQRTLTCG